MDLGQHTAKPPTVDKSPVAAFTECSGGAHHHDCVYFKKMGLINVSFQRFADEKFKHVGYQI